MPASRQGGTPGIAGEEGHPQLLLQLGDLLGQGGLSHVAGLGRQGKIPRIGHGQHIAKRVKFHMVSCLPAMGRPPVPAAGGAGSKSVFQTNKIESICFVQNVKSKGKAGARSRVEKGCQSSVSAIFPDLSRKFGAAISFLMIPAVTNKNWTFSPAEVVYGRRRKQAPGKRLGARENKTDVERIE